MNKFTLFSLLFGLLTSFQIEFLHASQGGNPAIAAGVTAGAQSRPPITVENLEQALSAYDGTNISLLNDIQIFLGNQAKDNTKLTEERIISWQKIVSAWTKVTAKTNVNSAIENLKKNLKPATPAESRGKLSSDQKAAAAASLTKTANNSSNTTPADKKPASRFVPKPKAAVPLAPLTFDANGIPLPPALPEPGRRSAIATSRATSTSLADALKNKPHTNKEDTTPKKQPDSISGGGTQPIQPKPETDDKPVMISSKVVKYIIASGVLSACCWLGYKHFFSKKSLLANETTPQPKVSVSA